MAISRAVGDSDSQNRSGSKMCENACQSSTKL